MFTVCPKCTLTLGVTASDLRVGQGYVRCGRCLNVFNALLTLSDEPDLHVEAEHHVDPASASQISAAISAAQAPDEPSEPADSGPADAASSANVSQVDGPAMHLALEQSSDGGIENASSRADSTGTFETIVLEGDAITATEEFVPEESVDSEIESLTRRLDVAANEPIATLLGSSASARMRTANRADADAESDPDFARTYWADAALLSAAASHDSSSAPAATDDADIDLAAAIVDAEGAQRRRWPWWTGTAVLLLLLAAQAVNHWRDQLASLPAWNAMLTRVYTALGVRLEPHWQLSAYDVRQEGADADSIDPHAIRVRLSLTNRAARAQPAPLLRLTLLDRYGKPVAERDLTPREYWPHGSAPRALLARDERIDSEVTVRDPSASASFVLDVCLADARGAVRCAGDQPAADTVVSRTLP